MSQLRTSGNLNFYCSERWWSGFSTAKAGSTNRLPVEFSSFYRLYRPRLEPIKKNFLCISKHKYSYHDLSTRDNSATFVHLRAFNLHHHLAHVSTLLLIKVLHLMHDCPSVISDFPEKTSLLTTTGMSWFYFGRYIDELNTALFFFVWLITAYFF